MCDSTMEKISISERKEPDSSGHKATLVAEELEGLK